MSQEASIPVTRLCLNRLKSCVVSLALGLALVCAVQGGNAQAQTTVYRPSSETQTDTTRITTPYATNGRTRTWAYSWNAMGQLLRVDGPLPGTRDTVTYTYTELGYLSSVTNELGHVTTVTAWNGRGQPATVVDPNGVTTHIT